MAHRLCYSARFVAIAHVIPQHRRCQYKACYRSVVEPLAAHADLPHDGSMQPNLARISADGDARAQAILRRAQGTVSQHFLDTLDERDYVALGRFWNTTGDCCTPQYGEMADLLRVFGARQDVTLEAFGWELIQTPEGSDFIPT